MNGRALASPESADFSRHPSLITSEDLVAIFLPLIKGEMQEGVVLMKNSNHPFDPLLYKEGKFRERN